jgi:cytoskeletal protein RodZ
VSNEAEAESVDREVEEEDHKSGNKLIPLLAALLVLIPIILLIGMYINNQINGPDKNNDVAVTADKKETSTEEKTTEKAAKDKDDKDSKTAAADKSTEEAATEEAVTEETTTEEVTTEEAVTEETTEQATTETPSTEEADEDSSNTVGTTHVVGSNENLYRIAIKYYGSGSAENVEKIRRANGLSGNEIGAGQTLVIPK